MLTPIIESHAHYDDTAFDEDREQLLGTMAEHGIGTIIDVGASMDSTRRAIELAHRYPFIYAAIGVHPNETGNLSESDMDILRSAAADSKVAAIGEIGLDYHWDEPSRDIQKHWFCRQLQLAREVNLPVIIHSRSAAMDTIDLMRAEHADDLQGVVHCYSYSREMARTYLDMGYYFGIGGVVTFQNAKKLKDAVQFIPMDRILLETDSPYLAPVPNRGKRNDSRNLPIIAHAIAELKGLSDEEVIHIAADNTRKLFTRINA